MQFTAIVTAALVATAVAVPTTSYTPETPSSNTPSTGNCNGGQGTIVCCNNNGLLGVITCAIGLCSVGSNGGSAFCCNNVQVSRFKSTNSVLILT